MGVERELAQQALRGRGSPVAKLRTLVVLVCPWHRGVLGANDFPILRPQVFVVQSFALLARSSCQRHQRYSLVFMFGRE